MKNFVSGKPFTILQGNPCALRGVSCHIDNMQKVDNTQMNPSHTASPSPLSKIHSNNLIVTINITLFTDFLSHCFLAAKRHHD